MALVAEAEQPKSGEGLTVAAIASRQYAIKEIHPGQDGHQQVARHSHPHYVTRLIGRKASRNRRKNVGHFFVRFADRQPTDGIAVKADLNQGLCALGAQFLVKPALNDSEKSLIFPAMEVLADSCPSDGAIDGGA